MAPGDSDLPGAGSPPAGLLPPEKLFLGHWPARERNSTTLEAARRVDLKPPAFVLNQSDRDFCDWRDLSSDIHGSFLTKYENVWLFGPNLVFDRSGRIASEFRDDFRQFVDYVNSDFFREGFPGNKPKFANRGSGLTLDFRRLGEQDVLPLPDDVFLATPVEPENWGRWILTVVPKFARWKAARPRPSLLCHADLAWQRRFISYFGVEPEALIAHEPGRLYSGRRIETIEFSHSNFTVSAQERALFLDLADRERRAHGGRFDKIFLSRRSLAARFPDYRALSNESNLVAALEARGFATIEAENFSLAEQIAIFGSARVVVALSGAALFNVVFCRPGARIVTIETDESHALSHASLIASLQLVYGVIVGRQDLRDETPVHKRWSLNIHQTVKAISAFL